jgi:hypothetical protein
VLSQRSAHVALHQEVSAFADSVAAVAREASADALRARRAGAGPRGCAATPEAASQLADLAAAWTASAHSASSPGFRCPRRSGASLSFCTVAVLLDSDTVALAYILSEPQLVWRHVQVRAEWAAVQSTSEQLAARLAYLAAWHAAAGRSPHAAAAAPPPGARLRAYARRATSTLHHRLSRRGRRARRRLRKAGARVRGALGKLHRKVKKRLPGKLRKAQRKLRKAFKQPLRRTLSGARHWWSEHVERVRPAHDEQQQCSAFTKYCPLDHCAMLSCRLHAYNCFGCAGDPWEGTRPVLQDAQGSQQAGPGTRAGTGA